MPADDLPTATPQPATGSTRFRAALLSDAPAIWKLVGDSGGLDPNSRYCYLLLCRDFADTCVVACRDTELVGFVTAYRPPGRPGTIFVWQIGVAPSARRQGVARQLLDRLIALPACHGVRYLEATIAPSNGGSRHLFQSFASDRGVACRIETEFTTEMFGSGGHEQEDLFRIGPLAGRFQER